MLNFVYIEHADSDDVHWYNLIGISKCGSTNILGVHSMYVVPIMYKETDYLGGSPLHLIA